jgi:hypothetical protein
VLPLREDSTVNKTRRNRQRRALAGKRRIDTIKNYLQRSVAAALGRFTNKTMTNEIRLEMIEESRKVLMSFLPPPSPELVYLMEISTDTEGKTSP